MATLDIRPHSRRGSLLAVAAFALIAVGAFAEGLGHQMAPRAASPFPPPQAPDPYAHIAEARAAPVQDFAPRTPVRHAAAPAAEDQGADAATAAADPDAAAPPVLQVPDPVATPAATAPPTASATPVSDDDAPH